MERGKKWVALLDGASLDGEGRRSEAVSRKLRQVGPLAVECSRVQSCLRTAAILCNALGCKLTINSAWDPSDHSLQGDDLLLEGDPLDYFLSVNSAEYIPPAAVKPAHDFTAGLLAAITSDSAVSRLVVVPAPVLEAVVGKVTGDSSGKKCVFALVDSSPLEVRCMAESVEDIALPSPAFDCEEPNEPISVRLTTQLNRDLAHSLTDPIQSFQASLRPINSLEKLEHAQKSLEELKNQMHKICSQLEEKVVSVGRTKDKQNQDVKQLLENLAGLIQQQDSFQTRLSSSVESLIVSASALSIDIATKSSESRKLQSQVAALIQLPHKPLPIDIQAINPTPDGGYAINVVSLKHYSMYAMVEITGPEGVHKKDYKVLVSGYQEVVVSDPGSLPTGHYQLFIKKKDDTKVISNSVEFDVLQPAPVQQQVDEWDYRHSFVYQNTANILEVEAYLDEVKRGILRKLALAWVNPNTEEIERFLTLLLSEPANVIQAELETNGFRFDPEKLAFNPR